MKQLPGLVWLAGALALSAGDPKHGPSKGEGADKFARVQATLYLDKNDISQAVGGELEAGIVVLDVTITPAEGKTLSIRHDDFLLRSDRSGERSSPYSPSQIAGSSVMRVSSRALGPGGTYTQNRGPGWGGMGGRPRTMPGLGAQTMGNGTAQATEAAASIDEGSGKQPENPLLVQLTAKILPENYITAPVTGQLYFLMEGKQKVKDLELLYKTEAGRVSVRFKVP
ncbi:MAG: hypothetical protein FJW31_18535 [Acidobacteria bacterium]|nr:hypothetical protein [Acidobacteriota bacterium]